MTSLIDKNTRLVVQGITGSAGAFHAKNCMDFGTNVVAGVTPARAASSLKARSPSSTPWRKPKKPRTATPP
ncbi:hypothetical protein RGQ01_10595 [Akkermansia sp. EB-AMDK43]|nr:hypothetical protein [Akkermansia sp. EB-AMDK43]WMX37462.1 hypothetical protein RGQ01_10595 [Akkermansia sp. EB-AMDK43]